MFLHFFGFQKSDDMGPLIQKKKNWDAQPLHLQGLYNDTALKYINIHMELVPPLQI